MAFYIGQKVVCIEDKHPISKDHVFLMESIKFIAKNRIYDITNVYAAYDGELMLELLNEPFFPGYLPSFPAVYFCPIVSRPTDISIFTAMLGPIQKVDA